MRESQLKGRLRLRHLLEVTEARGEEMDGQRERFERLADPKSAPRVVSAFNLFQTPEPLAERIACMFPAFGRTLEPSAGLGRLYRAVRSVSADPITLVDNSPDCCRELYHATTDDHAARLIQADFLSLTVDRLGRFDAIIMNPPFHRGQDIQHIRHALKFLEVGGQLVSICAAGPRQMAELQGEASEWIGLPAGSFREAGTNVETAIVVYRI